MPCSASKTGLRAVDQHQRMKSESLAFPDTKIIVCVLYEILIPQLRDVLSSNPRLAGAIRLDL